MSSNCLCGMQDMKNVEEKSTLSHLYQTGRTHFSHFHYSKRENLHQILGFQIINHVLLVPR